MCVTKFYIPYNRHLVSRLGMNGAKPPHSYITFIAYIKTTLPFIQQTKWRLLTASLNKIQTQIHNIRHAMYLQRNVEACWCKHFLRWKRNVLYILSKGKGKGLPQQAEMAQGVPGRLRPRIFLTISTTMVVGRQPCAPAAFTPGEISGACLYSFLSYPACNVLATYCYSWPVRLYNIFPH
jgi:hypothetical protein